MTELERFPIEALVALVERGTCILQGDLMRYGEFQTDPRRTPALLELDRRFTDALSRKDGE